VSDRQGALPAEGQELAIMSGAFRKTAPAPANALLKFLTSTQSASAIEKMAWSLAESPLVQMLHRRPTS